MEVYSLYELNQYIRQVIALNFVDAFWISCEISQVSVSRGHCYMDLVEKEELTDVVKAKNSAVIWYKEFLFIQKKLGKMLDNILQEGMQVKLKVELDYNERYGFKLVIRDIDPAYSYGQLAIQREKIIEKLRSEERMTRNSELPFPQVIQKIAVISSETAAGYQDLDQHLKMNPYGFAFSTELFPSAMQGQRVEMELIAQLREIRKRNQFQLVIITRGGGSKLDLSAFDSYAIAKEISEMNIPVITGIGHDIDESIADMVSALALKTPTAVANFILDHNAAFESKLYDMAIKIKLSTQARFKRYDNFLSQASEVIKQRSVHLLSQKLDQLKYIEKDIPKLVQYKLQSKEAKLDQFEAFIRAANPERILKNGYSLAYKNGERIQDIESIQKDDILEIKMYKGSITTKTQSVKINKK